MPSSQSAYRASVAARQSPPSCTPQTQILRANCLLGEKLKGLQISTFPNIQTHIAAGQFPVQVEECIAAASAGRGSKNCSRAACGGGPSSSTRSWTVWCSSGAKRCSRLSARSEGPRIPGRGTTPSEGLYKRVKTRLKKETHVAENEIIEEQNSYISQNAAQVIQPGNLL